MKNLGTFQPTLRLVILSFNTMAKQFCFEPHNNPGWVDRYKNIRAATICEIDKQIESQSGDDKLYWQKVKDINLEIMNWDKRVPPA